MADLDTPALIYPQAVLGYRTWRMVDGHLCPLFINDHHWLPGINIAECAHGSRAFGGDHQAPAENCHCGFNAYDDYASAFEEACTWLDWFRGRQDPWKLLIGAIAGAGQVCVHQSGFRCRQAQIIGLTTEEYLSHGVSGYDAAFAKIRDRYRLPIFKDSQYLEEYALALPGVSPAPQQARPAGKDESGKAISSLRWLLKRLQASDY